jgi:serine/threonine protein kinase
LRYRLDSRGIVKIGDFGVAHFFDNEGSGAFENEHDPNGSKILSRQDTETALAMKKLSDAGMLNKTEGTWCFYSPEMAAGEKKFSGFAADMWAAGICLYIFVSSQLPFYSEVPTDLFKSIVEDEVPYANMGFSAPLIDLLKATLHKDATQRAGVGDCLNHPFLSVAREKRVKQLSVAFENSRKRKLIVSEEDIRKAFRVVTALAVTPVEIFRNTTVAIREGFHAAREKLSLSRSSSWQSDEEDDEDDDEDDEDELMEVEIPKSIPGPALVEDSDRTHRAVTKKQASTLSQGTSNISNLSDASSPEQSRKKFRFGRFRSMKEERKSASKRYEDQVKDCKDDLYVGTANGKKTRFRKGSRLGKSCIIS